MNLTWPLALTMGLIMSIELGCAMPGKSFTGPLPVTTPAQNTLADELRADVTHLAKEIGERNIPGHPEALAKAADYIEQQFQKAGLKVTRQNYDVAGHTCANLFADVKGES